MLLGKMHEQKRSMQRSELGQTSSRENSQDNVRWYHNKLAMVLLSNYTIKWRIQELSVNILKQTIAAANRSGILL